ncbi:glutathione S-transferase [Blyttiomyces helicus]|uniref:glutathione transferase n=1 Tax=Blyttiomyces helicus TaxID=388810 RepID=A0A4P9W826_9FUNG|nr:glutathione S-transferase [Blyttiomyces helicus]|eukprot:RKO86940.1 glutathione S-transferase [Blyttiomyces helicus]
MVIKIHGMPYSTCTRRVLTALAEKGASWELVVVDLAKGAHKSPEFLKHQPFGQIPVLEDPDTPGFFMFESRAMCRYVDAKYKGKGTDLMGSTPQETALIETWLSVEISNFDPFASKLVAEVVFKKMYGRGDPDAAVVAELRAGLTKTLDVYETRLATNEYLVGKQFTMADLAHLPYFGMLEAAGAGDIIDAHPNVKKWWGRISSRPSWAKANGK